MEDIEFEEFKKALRAQSGRKVFFTASGDLDGPLMVAKEGYQELIDAVNSKEYQDVTKKYWDEFEVDGE